MAEELDDEYVATLLKREAKASAKQYELVGIDAFNPKRPQSGAPKPNTSFLRNIIRQTDSHNAAILAKEAEESSARLKDMNRANERRRGREHEVRSKKADGRLTPVHSDEDVRSTRTRGRGRGSYSEDAPGYSDKNGRKERDRSRDRHSRMHEHSSRDTRREKRRYEMSEDDEPARKHRRHDHRRDDARSRKDTGDEEGRSHKREHRSRGYRSYRSYSRSASPRSSNTGTGHRRRDRSRSPRSTYRSSQSSRTTTRQVDSSRKPRQRSASSPSESDPLEAIVGPLPPRAQPSVRSRGRGAHKANTTGIESRFSSTYDPTNDIRPSPDAEDKWGDSVEAFRDRQRWKQQGADRLKAAGFTDAQVKKWEKGDELNEDDVVWARKGEAREWDRGKVVDEDGDIELKADFGRLK